MLDELMPGIPYTLSHQLVPILREYRRASATAIDASLKPLMQRHLREMSADLRAAGFAGDLLVSTSVGGCQQVDDLIARPINTLKSGPAMAPVAGRAYAAIGGAWATTRSSAIRAARRSMSAWCATEALSTRATAWLGQRWLGDIMGTSTVDVRSIGAGGGSIAWVDCRRPAARRTAIGGLGARARLLRPWWRSCRP